MLVFVNVDECCVEQYKWGYQESTGQGSFTVHKIWLYPFKSWHGGLTAVTPVTAWSVVKVQVQVAVFGRA